MVIDSGDAICAPSVAAKPVEQGLAMPFAQLAVTPVVRAPLPGIALETPLADEVLPAASLPAKLDFKSPPPAPLEVAQVPAPRRDSLPLRPGAQPSTRRPSSSAEDASRLASRVGRAVASVPRGAAAAPAALDLSNDTDSDVDMAAPPPAAVPVAATAAVASAPPPRAAAGAPRRGAPAQQRAAAGAAAAPAAQAPSAADFAAVRRAISSFASSEHVLVEGLSPARLRAALPDLAPETIEVGGWVGEAGG